MPEIEITENQPHPRSYRPDIPLAGYPSSGRSSHYEMKSGKRHAFDLTSPEAMEQDRIARAKK